MDKSNVCSFEHLSREGFHMRVIFIDDFSKSTAVYPLRSKNQTFQYFRHFHSAFEKQNSCSILSLVSENGGEYMGHKFQNHLCDKGIVHEPGTPPPHLPQLNGFAKRANRTLCDCLRCCLLGVEVPKSFWTNTLCHLVFSMISVLCNTHSPNSISGSPLIDTKYLHPFGCLVWYKVREANGKKLDPKGCAAMLLSYLANGNGYKVWDLETRTVIKSRDVIFCDDVFPYKHQIEQPLPAPVQAEIEWPITTSTPVSSTPPLLTPRVGIFCSDCRLQASSHNPDNAVTASPHSPPLPPSPPPVVISPPSPPPVVVPPPPVSPPIAPR